MGGKLEKGLVQVYTGNGKGKSTASFGLAVRAVGGGLKVYIIQFLKTGIDYGEIVALSRFEPELCIKSFGRKGFIRGTGPTDQDFQLAEEAFALARQVAREGKVDLLILDEINTALYFKLLKLEEVLDFLAHKPEDLEVVLTGRYAPQEIIEAADLVTEMRMIKHPYEKGIAARKGIEF
ncbi:cob(I)yrinic acid a,c-diamide adenosyltransferase [Zhaonella formicivorans]|jgi:cob(I)alamin adenosyltransferase|uniref:cob(I)yrinic acid a,c-diamide adenosyltransferase n=1 Tax=Zhaonella formicivorans TaxID=2528593 RepID=UPI0010D6A435|nr:cob(I)yrinic acid a,c-diamide adenosyltransferase [Zhaonella formicivorans]